MTTNQQYRVRALAAAAVVACALGCNGPTEQASTPEAADRTSATAQPLGFAPDTLVLKLSPDVGAALRAHLDKYSGIDGFKFPKNVAMANSSYGASAYTPLFPEQLGDEALREELDKLQQAGRGVDPNATLYQLDNIFVVTLAAGTPVVRAAADYQLSGSTVWAEPIALAELAYVPSDPLYSQQWGPQRIDCDNAWDYAFGAGTTIAIVDSGMDAGHPDLSSQIWTNALEAGGLTGIDDDGNGYVDDVYGWDFSLSSGSTVPIDPNGHGTVVAGIAGAVADTVGVIGVAPGAQLMNVRVINSGGGVWHTDVAAGIGYAAVTGASVINVSISSVIPSQVMEDAVKTAHLLGIPVVAAAGNHPIPVIEVSPANVEWATAVGSSTDTDAWAYYSNYGVKVDVAAPGGVLPMGILAPQTGGGYTTNYAGTSMAAPHVAGLYALLREVAPNWSVEELRQAILVYAQDIEAAGFDVLSGHGRVDALQSVATTAGAPSKPMPTANVVEPSNGGHVAATMNVQGYADVSPATTGSYTLDWAPTLAGPWTSFGGGSLTGGAASGLTTLGSISPSIFPSAGNYIIRQQTTDAYSRVSSDYNEIEVCGSCLPNLPNLVSRWKFEAAGGALSPDAVGSNDGTYFDDAGSAPLGRVGRAASFFGNNDRMVAPDNTPGPNLTMAVAAWIKPATFHTGVITSWHKNSVAQWELAFNQNTFYFKTCIFGNCPTFTASAVMINAQAWTHVVAVIEEYLAGQLTLHRVRLYVNGVLNPTCTGNGCSVVPNFTSTSGTPQFTVGGGSNLGTGSFQGQIDEVEYYSDSLTAAEVAALYNSGCAGGC